MFKSSTWNMTPNPHDLDKEKQSQSIDRQRMEEYTKNKVPEEEYKKNLNAAIEANKQKADYDYYKEEGELYDPKEVNYTSEFFEKQHKKGKGGKRNKKSRKTNKSRKSRTNKSNSKSKSKSKKLRK